LNSKLQYDLKKGQTLQIYRILAKNDQQPNFAYSKTSFAFGA
jgi:hypothetical protein